MKRDDKLQARFTVLGTTISNKNLVLENFLLFLFLIITKNTNSSWFLRSKCLNKIYGFYFCLVEALGQLPWSLCFKSRMGLASLSCRFIPGKESLGILCIDGWVSLRTELHMAKRKFSAGNQNLPLQLIASHYTYWAVLASAVGNISFMNFSWEFKLFSCVTLLLKICVDCHGYSKTEWGIFNK